MANVTYALLVREISAQVDRDKLDRILAGEVILPMPGQPEMDDLDRNVARDRTVPPLPNPRTMDGKIDLDKLREQWGATPDAIRSKALFDQEMRQLPKQK